MCIIAVKKAGAEMFPETTIRTMFTNNPDGAGIMYYDYLLQKVIYHKGFMKVEQLLDFIKDRDWKNIPVVLHFRIGTSGHKTKLCTHPFPVFDKNKVFGTTDLAVCMATVSSARGVSARPNTLILGEVGLSGEIRPVSRILKRCLASVRLGITTVVLPGSSKDALEKELANASADVFAGNPVPEFIYADNLKEAADILFS